MNLTIPSNFINLCEALQPAAYEGKNKVFGGCFFVPLCLPFSRCTNKGGACEWNPESEEARRAKSSVEGCNYL